MPLLVVGNGMQSSKLLKYDENPEVLIILRSLEDFGQMHEIRAVVELPKSLV